MTCPLAEFLSCSTCGAETDADGAATAECPGGSGEKCEDCFGCACDASC